MQRTTFIAFAAAALLLAAASSAAGENKAASLELEPAMNGGVSATGLFPAQRVENGLKTYLKGSRDRQDGRFVFIEPRGKELEPALNGGVSASGMFPSQAMEDQFADKVEWTENRRIRRIYAIEAADGI